MNAGQLERWRHVVAGALVALTAWVSIAPALHGGGHDADCDPAIVFHDASQHRFSSEPAGSNAAPGDHCVACHLFRGSRIAGEWRFVPQGLDAAGDLHQIGCAPAISQTSVPLPARAPPVLS